MNAIISPNRFDLTEHDVVNNMSGKMAATSLVVLVIWIILVILVAGFLKQSSFSWMSYVFGAVSGFFSMICLRLILDRMKSPND